MSGDRHVAGPDGLLPLVRDLVVSRVAKAVVVTWFACGEVVNLARSYRRPLDPTVQPPRPHRRRS